MNTAIRIATDYLTARTTGNVEDALAMASDDLILKTSMQATHGKAALRAALEHFAPLARSALTLQQFATAAGTDVCTAFELEVNLAGATETILISEVDIVYGPRVAQSLLIFDSASLQANTAPSPCHNPEVDPVCGNDRRVLHGGGHPTRRHRVPLLQHRVR